MPQVTLLMRSLTGGGAERVMFNLAVGFAQRGLLVDILATDPGQTLPLDAPKNLRLVQLDQCQFGRWSIRWRRPILRSLVRFGAILQYLKKEEPPVLLSAMHYLNETAILAVKASGCKTRCVVAEHTNLTQETRYVEQWQARFAPMLVRSLYRHADLVIAVSKGVAADLAPIAKLPLASIRVLCNPVLSASWYDSVNDGAIHNWLKSKDTPVVMGMGRFVRQKNFGLLIQAFSLLLLERPEARLMLVGGGRDQVALEEMAVELGVRDRIAFVKFIDNPAAYLSRASVLALSSSWEGLPTVIIEALALAVPVVATDCPSGPHELLAERRGRLVPPGNPQAMASAIALAMGQPGSDADQAWLEQFDVSRAVECYAAALQLDLPEAQDRSQVLATAQSQSR